MDYQVSGLLGQNGSVKKKNHGVQDRRKKNVVLVKKDVVRVKDVVQAEKKSDDVQAKKN